MTDIPTHSDITEQERTRRGAWFEAQSARRQQVIRATLVEPWQQLRHLDTLMALNHSDPDTQLSGRDKEMFLSFLTEFEQEVQHHATELRARLSQ